YDAYWNALGGVPASLQGQINALNAQIDQYYIAAQNDPANAHNYAILAYPLEQQRNELQSQQYQINQVLANQSSYSVGGPLPDFPQVANQRNTYNLALVERPAAESAYNAANAAYQAKNNAANTAENLYSTKHTAATNLRTEATAKQVEATEALELAQQLERDYYAGLGYVAAPTY